MGNRIFAFDNIDDNQDAGNNNNYHNNNLDI
jgi:hypothetical protein